MMHRGRAPREGGLVEKYCDECAEEYQLEQRECECPVCGSLLQERIVEQEPAPAAEIHELDDQLRDWLAGVLTGQQGAPFPFPSPHDATTNGLSEEEFDSLDQLIVDENSYVLRRTVALVGTAEVEAIAGLFSATIPSGEPIKATIVAADPPHGEGPLRNVGQVAENIVFMRRGVCTFADKALRAREAGARALLIGQTHDVWPYVMTDSTGVVTAENTMLPVLMVSRRDSDLICQALQQAESAGQMVQCKLDSSENNQECIICARNYEIGDQLVRLPCTHHYHSECIKAWLRTHRTCPLCRQEIPKAKPTQQEQVSSPQGLPELIAMMLQPDPDRPAPEHFYS